MYRDRLVETKTTSVAAKQLKTLMIAYHDYQAKIVKTESGLQRQALSLWQSERLKWTHHDLYHAPEYTHGLSFLLSQLYAPKDFSARDKDLERVFPKLVKWLPDSVIETVAILVELNLLTQSLDDQLARQLFTSIGDAPIEESAYAMAYRLCNNRAAREQQLWLIEKAGLRLNRYASNPIIQWSLRFSKSSAEKAGLSALHQFISEGFEAFHSMDRVEHLLRIVMQRERMILDNLYQAHAAPFSLPED